MANTSPSVLRLLSARYTTFTTRQALLILGLQQSTINTAEFAPTDSSIILQNLKELVPTFRKNGDVFWIPTACSTGDQCDASISPYVAEAAALQTPSDTHLVKTDYSAFKGTSLLSILRARFITEVYLVGCFTDLCVYHTAVDAAQYGIQINIVEDCLGFSSPYRHTKALNCMTEDLGAYITTSNTLLDRFGRHTCREDSYYRSSTPDSDRNSIPDLDYDSVRTRESFSVESDSGHLEDQFDQTPGIHDHYDHMHMDPITTEALDSIAKDMAVPVEECTLTGNLSTPTPGQDFATPLNEITAPELTSTEDPADAIHLESLESALNSDMAIDSQSSDQRDISPESSSRKRRSADLDDAAEESHSVPQQSDNSHAEGDREFAKVRKKARRLPDNLSTFPSKGPGDSIGCGDTFIRYGLLPSAEADQAFLDIFTQVPWQTMSHISGHVPRLVCCQGSISHTDFSFPVYRHPSDTVLPLISWSPAVLKLRAAAEAIAGHALNHGLIQLYRGGGDFISEHSDKTLDIVPGSNIVNVSLGAQRTMRLRTKRSPSGSGGEKERTTERIHLPHNSLLVMGLETNKHFLHAIQQDRRLPHDLSGAEVAFGGVRISITFRHIGTFLSFDSKTIWGQGATGKNRSDARPTVNGDETVSGGLLRMFGRENQGSDLRWEDIYGAGSDVLNIASPLVEGLEMLFLSGDGEEDEIVRQAVEERGREVVFVPPPHVRIDEGHWRTAEVKDLPALERRRVMMRSVRGECIYGAHAIVAYLGEGMESEALGQ